MKNFPFDHNGTTLWYARSIITNVYVYCRDDSVGEYSMLTIRRGPGCQTGVGKWSVPGGYLDFNETIEQAARRELYEETGLDFRKDKNIKFNLCRVCSDPKSTNQAQSVLYSYWVELPEWCSDYKFDLKNNEPGEVSDIKWTPISEINRTKFKHFKWAFDSDGYGKLYFKKFIGCSCLDRIINSIENKILKKYIK